MGTATTESIADIVPAEKRGWAIGIYERTWFVGWIVGPMVCGYSADTIGFRSTFLVGSIIVLAGLAILILKVKEIKRKQV